MPRIQRLDTSVVNKIAAGEVIERPANVVKELLENSIDALSTHIEIDIVEGGSELIRITDNGEGIHPDDLLLAVASHATSKIRSADDLFHIQTMGFRGEALASIAEVSQFKIRSRQRDALSGVELEVNCGDMSEVQPCGCPTGTTIEIRNLFTNTPVRRKFLKTKSTEFGHISEQLTRIALANPRLHLVLRHNGKVAFDLPPTDRLIDRLKYFFGSSISDHLIWVESEVNGVRMWGYVAHPSQNKPSRKWQHLFLNGRWFQDRAIQHALTEAYRGLLMVGRQPICFLFMDMPPSLVDVNVHPTKVEVRFVDSQQLYRQLLAMIRTKFLSLDLDSELKVAAAAGDDSEGDEFASVNKPPRELQSELSAWVDQQVASAMASDELDEAPPPLTTWSVASERSSEEIATAASLRADSRGSATATPTLFEQDFAELPETSEAADALFAERESPLSSEPPPQASRNSTRSEIDASVTTSRESGLRAMQVMDCYLVVESDKGLLIIDQHALHERIMYEYLRPRVLNGSVESQRMLIPETVELPAKEKALVMEHQELLAQFGFGIEEFGTNTVLINKHPVMLKRANFPVLLRDIAEQLEQLERQPTRRDLLDSMLHMMSCKAAIKSGQRLAPEEINSLIAQRHLVEDAHHCPHGRPTALTLSQQELDRQFGRLG
jgi:DNA mismatch repair protein MutL